jgi:hypothetical protein
MLEGGFFIKFLFVLIAWLWFRYPLCSFSIHQQIAKAWLEIAITFYACAPSCATEEQLKQPKIHMWSESNTKVPRNRSV